MQYSTATQPRFVNAEGSAITLLVTFLMGDAPAEPAEEEEALPDTRTELVVPFTATPNDPAEHGRALYASALAGDFGAVAPFVQPVVVPEAVDMAQAKLELAYSGYYDQVVQALVAMTGVEGTAARIEFADRRTVRRDSPLTAAMIQILGLSSAQADALFISAATR